MSTLRILFPILILAGAATALAEPPVWTVSGSFAWTNPGGNLLQDLDSGPGFTAAVSAALGKGLYLKAEGVRLDPGILDEAIYAVDEDEVDAVLTSNYDYKDLCLLLGTTLGRARHLRPQPYLELGGGIGYEQYEKTGIHLANGEQTPLNPDLVFFVLAFGGGVRVPVVSNLAVDLGVSWRLHWDTDPGTGFFDSTTGQIVPVEEFEGSATYQGSLMLLKAGVAWTFF